MEVVETPSEVRAAAHSATLEAIALVGALAEERPAERSGDGARDAAVRWLEELRHVHLAITGDDLLAAGIPAGPEIGARLEAVLRSRLDGELSEGRDAELRAALAGSARDSGDATSAS